MHFNTYWYLAIALVSVISLIGIIIHTKSWNAFLLYVIMVGYGYMVEFVIYILLGSYHYYPKILPDHPYYDSNMGAVASNFLSLPVSAVAAGMYQMNWKRIGLLVVLFAGIEWLFLELHIYRHNWWNLGYTAAGLPFYYALSKVWAKWLHHPLHGIRKALLLFLITGMITSNFQVASLMIMHTRNYRLGWFADPERDATAVAAVFYMLVSLLFTGALMLRSKHSKLKFMLTVAVVLGVTLLFKGLSIIRTNVWWDTLFGFAASVIGLWLASLAAKRLSYEKIRR